MRWTKEWKCTIWFSFQFVSFFIPIFYRQRLVHSFDDMANIQYAWQMNYTQVTIKAGILQVMELQTLDKQFNGRQLSYAVDLQSCCLNVSQMTISFSLSMDHIMIQCQETRWLLLKRLKLLSLGSFSVLSQVVLVLESTLIFAFDLGFV